MTVRDDMTDEERFEAEEREFDNYMARERAKAPGRGLSPTCREPVERSVLDYFGYTMHVHGADKIAWQALMYGESPKVEDTDFAELEARIAAWLDAGSIEGSSASYEMDEVRKQVFDMLYDVCEVLRSDASSERERMERIRQLTGIKRPTEGGK